MPAAMASRHNQVGIKMAALGAATVFAASLSFQTASAPSGILSATAAATAAFAAVFAARVGFAAAVPVRGAPRRAEKVVRACGTWSVSSGGGITSSSSSFMGSSMAGSVTGPVATPSNSSGSALSSMSMMFERFNEKAIKAVMMAQEESRRLGHNYVGTEMLLVGVVADTSGPSGKVLKKFNVTLKETRKTMEEMVGRGTGMVSVEIPFTPAAKRVLGDGVEEAKRLNANTIDTAHILLALLKEDNGNAVKILEKLGVDPSKMPDEIIKELQEKDERSLVGVTSRGGGSGKTVTLEEFGNDLTKAAEEGKMDPLVGRAAELERTIQILARRQKNNPVLIGEPGVGKTAIAEGLAQKIVAGDVPELLQGLISRKRIVQLDLAMLLAGTRYRGEFEERLKNVIKEVLDSKKQIILMIDEIHTIVGAGGTGDGGGAIDAGNIMKPALSRGELQVIGATTIEEYRKYIEKDKALERRFQPVNVPEPTNEETLTILQGLAKKYEDIMATIATPPMREVFLRILHWFDLFLGDPQEHHKLKYTDEALAACVKFASQYIQDRFLPDKAIDVLDETGARVRLRESSILPEEAKEAQQKLKEEANLRTKIKSIISESKAAIVDEDEEEDESDDKPRKQILVTEADVAAVVSKWTGVPVEKAGHVVFGKGWEVWGAESAMVKVKKSSLKKGSELRAAVPSPKPSVEAAAPANPSKKLKKKGAKVAEVKGKVEKLSAGLAPSQGDSEAAGKVDKLDKAQLAAQATEEILRGIAKPDSQKISAFVLPDWHLKYKDVLGSYKKFVKASDKLQVVEREDGNYIIQRAGDTSVPPPPEAKEPKTKDWKQLLLNAWNIYHQATPKQELNLEVFISALPKGVRQVKPDEAEKPEVKEPKAATKTAKAKKEVVPTPAPEPEVTETKDKKPVKKIKTAKKKVSSDEGARLVKLEEVQPIIGPKIYHSASHAQGSPLMFDGLSWCAGFVKKNFTGDCHTSDDVESVEIPVNIPVKIEDVDISFEVKPASSTHSGSRASVSRLESCLELFSDFERVESEAISLMTTELSQQSFLVDVEEVLHKRPLCSTSHCQISTVQWRGQTVAMKEVILGCPFRCFQIAF
eukprot:s462_g35.t2